MQMRLGLWLHVRVLYRVLGCPGSRCSVLGGHWVKQSCLASSADHIQKFSATEHVTMLVIHTY